MAQNQNKSKQIERTLQIHKSQVTQATRNLNFLQHRDQTKVTLRRHEFETIWIKIQTKFASKLSNKIKQQIIQPNQSWRQINGFENHKLKTTVLPKVQLVKVQMWIEKDAKWELIRISKLHSHNTMKGSCLIDVKHCHSLSSFYEENIVQMKIKLESNHV